MSAYSPERLFGRCDTAETVQLLKTGLAASSLDVVQVDGMNTTGRDCVILALMYGVKENTQGRRIVHDVDQQGAAVDLGDMTVANIRQMCADHIRAVWDAQGKWAREALRMHVDHEARMYLNLLDARLHEVRDAYCNAICGVGCEVMYADQGVQLAFASRFTCTVVSWSPPRPRAGRSRNMLYRPFMFGSLATARASGEPGARTTCLMIMYVLGDGVGHAEPVKARSGAMGRPSRFTGVRCSLTCFCVMFVLGACSLCNVYMCLAELCVSDVQLRTSPGPGKKTTALRPVRTSWAQPDRQQCEF